MGEKSMQKKGGPDYTLENSPGSQVTLGQWYWVTSPHQWDDAIAGHKAGDRFEWLGCVMRIGSNYLELHEPHAPGESFQTERVQFDQFWDRLRYEPNADAVIKDKAQRFQHEVNRLLEEVRALTTRLGLKQTPSLSSPTVDTHRASDGQALMAVSNNESVESYGRALREAKEKTLPELFGAIEAASKELSRWTLASTMPTRALMGPMKDSVREIEDRIFNIGLYAGLTEDVVQFGDGKPADMAAKLHVMQRRLYMDEECLLNYTTGGMEFKDIREFDAWLAKPENRDRILPYPRTLVAMQVRRREKTRDWGGDPAQLFINIHLGESDRFTFLYVRNGERLWRLSCDIDFGEFIFPDRDVYDPAKPTMVRTFCGKVQEMISTNLYEELCAKYHSVMAQSQAWEEANPDKSWIHNPYRGMSSDLHISGRSFNPNDWQPFDQSNVHFDECMATIEKKLREYNRIALILQGLFDRSAVLHPHPPVRTWTPDGFRRAVELVYDGSTTLYNGDAPDFEAYRSRLNRSLEAGAVVTGQQDFWLRREAQREKQRLDNDWRNRSSYRHERFSPIGNPGPGLVARVAHWKPRARTAVFAWHREKMTDGEPSRTTITVPESALLNISAYTPGDYKQFFRDPRTRAQYLKWAPMLLAGEEYHAGKLQANEPV